MIKKLFFVGLILLSWMAVYAAPATPKPINYNLPDGSKITLRLHGDEWVNWYSTSDGYSVLFNGEGFPEYAIKDSFGDMKPSGVRANSANQRSSAERRYLSKQAPHLRYSSSQIQAMRKIQDFRNETMKSFKSQRKAIDTVRAPLVLVDFPEKPFSKTKADFEMLCNQKNYTANGAVGSVHDYFSATSSGKLVFLVDVFGPYTLSKTIANYDYESGGNPVAMALEAIDSVDVECDFSKYDRDANNIVDMLYIVFAGYDQASGALAGEAIWAHAGKIDTEPLHDGKKINMYACSGELRETSGTDISHIGIICHEMSHVFGLPDLYDTDDFGNGGMAVDPDQWDIMAYGSWNDGGRTPALHSAWCRAELGWMEVAVLENPADIVLKNPLEKAIAYRINTETPNEYFLLENRQKQDWDAYIPGGGLLIYHVDENNVGWTGNSVNSNPLRRGLYVKQANCSATNGCAENRETDPFPQGTKNSFTDQTIPNAKSWANVNTNKPVTEIYQDTEQGTVSFKFKGGDTTVPDAKLSAFVALPDFIHGEGKHDVEVKLESLGATMTSATLEWSINGVEQTSCEWTGELNRGEHAVVKLGTVDFTAGEYEITVLVSLSEEINTVNNRLVKSLRVTQPFLVEDFSRASSNWAFINGSETNKWMINTGVSGDTNTFVCISNNDSSNTYTTDAQSAVHILKDIAFPKSIADFELFFDFKGMGETFEGSFRDYMEVRLVPTNILPQAGYALSAGDLLGQYNNRNEWQTQVQSISSDYAGKTMRLVFSWYNDANDGEQTPAAIDNVAITYTPDTMPNRVLPSVDNGQLVIYPNPVINGQLTISFAELASSVDNGH